MFVAMPKSQITANSGMLLITKASRAIVARDEIKDRIHAHPYLRSRK